MRSAIAPMIARCSRWTSGVVWGSGDCVIMRTMKSKMREDGVWNVRCIELGAVGASRRRPLGSVRCDGDEMDLGCLVTIVMMKG